MKQGLVLLDWGFALPPDATVGRLVSPEEKRSWSFSLLAELRAGAAVTLVVMIVATFWWRSRPRRGAASR